MEKELRIAIERYADCSQEEKTDIISNIKKLQAMCMEKKLKSDSN